MIALTDNEITTLDAELEPVLAWAQTRSAEAEQLALDCARLLSCTEDRLGKISNQSFFKRCWNRFSGKTGEMERANTSDLIKMQKVSIRYINLLQERQLMMAHAMLSLRNNLVTLAIKEEETRCLLSDLAENTLRRFQELEKRVDQLEVSVNIQGWVLTLEDREYEEKYPSPYLRLLRIVNDFYMYKNDNWNYQDILFLKKSLRIININPKEKISIKDFVSGLTDEIKVLGFAGYENILMENKTNNASDFSKFILDNVSSQILTALHGLCVNYTDRFDVIETLSEELSIPSDVALNKLILRSISQLNVDTESTLSFADIAVEILSGMRLANCLAQENTHQSLNAEPTIEKYAIEPTSQNTPIDTEECGRQICKLFLDTYKDHLVDLKKMHLKYYGEFSEKISPELLGGNFKSIKTDDILVYFDDECFKNSTQPKGRVAAITKDLIIFKGIQFLDKTKYINFDKEYTPFEIKKIFNIVQATRKHTWECNNIALSIDDGLVKVQKKLLLDPAPINYEILLKKLLDIIKNNRNKDEYDNSQRHKNDLPPSSQEENIAKGSDAEKTFMTKALAIIKSQK